MSLAMASVSLDLNSESLDLEGSLMEAQLFPVTDAVPKYCKDLCKETMKVFTWAQGTDRGGHGKATGIRTQIGACIEWICRASMPRITSR